MEKRHNHFSRKSPIYTDLPHLMMSILLAVLVRWTTAIFSYSGKGKPPMYGDYEAQRHWQEVTYNLDIKSWYMNGTDNNLQYWGLDYPPLTAYHSWLIGIIANQLNPEWVALDTSKGFESYDHQLFMRYTVIVVDILLYFPAIYMFISQKKSPTPPWRSVLVALLYPGLILIDHGHFQYNCVSLALALWAVLGVTSGRHVLGSVAFCLSLNYKQMQLYHALPFFTFLLGICFQRGWKNGPILLVKLGLTVIATFALLWLPFLTQYSDTLQVLQRLFPFSRGIFEDKVANFWSSLNVIVKFREISSQSLLINASLVITALGLIPSQLKLLFNPTKQQFLLALVNSSMIFYMFSFQVHEKSILLAALPVCLLVEEYTLMSVWFLLISTFSMLPLLMKDLLVIPYIATTVLYLLLVKDTYGDFSTKRPVCWLFNLLPSKIYKYLFKLSVVGTVVLLTIAMAVDPPSRLPDLFAVLISCYSFIHFAIFSAYFHVSQLCMVSTTNYRKYD